MTATQKSIGVSPDEAGGRLDRLLAVHVGELSRTRLKALIEAGAVAIDGRTIRDPGYRVNSGASIQIDIPAPAPAKPAAEPIPLNVVYEDADIIVIDKPKGLVVHPAAGHATGTLVNALIAQFAQWNAERWAARGRPETDTDQDRARHHPDGHRTCVRSGHEGTPALLPDQVGARIG